MSTVALQMIVKDEVEQVIKLVDAALLYFTEVNLTVSDKPSANKLKSYYKTIPANICIIWREWTDDFSAARNENFKMCTTDFAFWLDADDEFDFKLIPQIVKVADRNEVDAIWMPYNYAQDEYGNCTTRHWRERMLRMSLPWEWRGRVHETCILDTDHISHKIKNEIVHKSDHGMESYERNHKILEKAYAETDDPRYMHYLGMSYFAQGNYDKCVEILNEYLKVGGSLEDSYRSLCVISEAAYHMGSHPIALEFATKASVMKPSYPMAYWLLAQYEADQKNWDEALEWVRVSESKPDPQTLSVWDPSSRQRAALLAAQAEFMLNNFNAALAWLKKAGKTAETNALFKDFMDAADAETFVQLVPKILKFFESPEAFWNALCKALKYDSRLKTVRWAGSDAKEWGDKSIVFFCGQGFEEWGPDTLDKGMGGSEEAVVYLSRELAKLGWEVTVFGDREDIYRECWAGEWTKGMSSNGTTINYKPWKMIDTRDRFNIFVAWRLPNYFTNIDAKVKICDMHDVLPEKLVMDNCKDITFMAKSQYHRSLIPKIADKNVVVVGNGILKEQFND